MEPKQKPVGTAKITAPIAMAELEIMKVEGAKNVANRSPEIRNIALLLIVVLGVTLFSQIISYLLVMSFGTTQISFFSVFISSNGVLGLTLLLVQVIAIFMLLFTKNTAHAKTILLVAGISFGISLVNGIFSFQVGPGVIASGAALVVNFLILVKIFRVYVKL
jgi:hypothetical protein